MDSRRVLRRQVISEIAPRFRGHVLTVPAIVLLRFIIYVGVPSVAVGEWHLQGIELADPDFTSMDEIDILGTDVYMRSCNQIVYCQIERLDSLGMYN